MFFFISKETLIVGEERIIVSSYLILFFLLFIFLNKMFSADFQNRKEVMQNDFVKAITSIIKVLKMMDNFVKENSLLLLRALKAYYKLVCDNVFALYFFLKFNYLKQF